MYFSLALGKQSKSFGIKMGCNESTNRRRNNGDENENDDRSDLMTDFLGSEKATADLALAGLAAVVIIAGVAVLASSSGDLSKMKTMKAPGRNYRIFRDDFEDDPSSYFRDLRKRG